MPAKRLVLLLALLAPHAALAGQKLIAVQAFAPSSILTVLGRRVVDPSGDEIGRLVDMLVDAEGKPKAAVLDVGGFLGIGARRVAVTWDALRFVPGTADISIVRDLTPEEVAAAPEFRSGDQPVQALMPTPPMPRRLP